MGIEKLLKFKSTFTVLIAPPAWGKTTRILDLYDDYLDLLIFVSPLRALANEFYARCYNGVRDAYILKCHSEVRNLSEKFFNSDKAIIVITPELANDYFFSLAYENRSRITFVIDEFHLFYYWGDSFRPALWEFCMAMANLESPILGLTATFNKKMLDRFNRDFDCAVDYKFIIDCGNQQLINYPTKMYYFSPYFRFSKKVFSHLFIKLLIKSAKKVKNDKDGVMLFFCKYRSEVDNWLRFCENKNIKAIGCKGGEVEYFLSKLDEAEDLVCIFSTSTLSHGVNLPIISKIFISYPLENLDFWIQFVGRGGRDGSKYEVFTFDSFFLCFKNKLLSIFIINYLIIKLSIFSRINYFSDCYYKVRWFIILLKKVI